LQERVIENRVLGLFPTLNAIGGVQASGHVAWQGVVERSHPENSHLFCYGDGNGLNSGQALVPAAHASSKLGAVLATYKIRRRVQYVLIWHLHLLKLLPFFRVRDARVILFLHGIEAWRRLDPISARLLQRVDLFLSNSEYTWQRFLRDNPAHTRAAHRVVHLGIEAPLTGEIARAADPPVALMLGRLLRSEDYKGHKEMIAAWPQLLQQVPDAELWIVGDGDLKEDLVRMAAERGLNRQVRFWGGVSEAEKFQLLSRCRCLALPSRGEGFGLVYLEAMRLGKPCLVSTLDAGREVVNPPEAGLAVNPTDTVALAEAICRLLADTAEAQTRARHAVQRYESNFTARHFQQRLVAAIFDEGAELN
jgi:phosphatidylinositol alpha-1,6-mannosyltransferase